MLEQLQTFLSPQVDAVVVTLVVILLAFMLIGVMRRVVTLALRRIAPQWIDRATILLQAAVLVGEIAFIVSFIAPGWTVAWVAIGIFALAAAALFPGNPLSNGVAFLRIRGLRYFPVSDWGAVARARYGSVVTIWPLRTRLRTPMQEPVGLPPSSVVGEPILIHTDQQGLSGAPVNQAPVEPVALKVEEAMPSPELSKPPMMPAARSQVNLIIPPRVYVAPLVKRPTLGKRTIKLMYR